jgi:hypothetical protein
MIDHATTQPKEAGMIALIKWMWKMFGGAAWD